MSFRRIRICTVAISAALAAAQVNVLHPVAAAAQTGAAGTSTSPSKSTDTLRSALDSVEYRVADRGALLVVAPDQQLAPDADNSTADSSRRLSLTDVAQRSDRIVVRVRGMTVLAPATMKLIEGNPGKANPIAGMSPGDTLKLLMGSFSSQQWEAACSQKGIGMEDLHGVQKLEFDNLLPRRIEVEKSTLSTASDPKPAQPEIVEVQDRSSVRIRLNREVTFEMQALGNDTRYFNSLGNSTESPDNTALRMVHEKNAEDEAKFSAYGVRLARSVPNRQKPGDIDFAAARLDAIVSLRELDAKSTVANLVDRISQATGLDITADRRAGDLTVYVLGDSVRAGDLLQAIAFAVTGAYRKIGATACYVLTSDISGFGTRMTQLAAWLKHAAASRRDLLEEAMDRAAKQHPLDYLHFVPGDSAALTPAQTRRIDSQFRKGSSWDDTMTASSDLPKVVRDAVAESKQSAEDGARVKLNTGGVYLGMTLSMSFLIPEIGTVPGPDLSSDPGLLSRLAANRTPYSPLKAKPASPLNWAWLDVPKLRRVLLFTPATVQEADHFVDEASRHGMKEVWLRVDLAKPDVARSLLTAAIAEGKRRGVTVAADVSLLQNNAVAGEDERTISGESGAEFVANFLTEYPAEGTARGWDMTTFLGRDVAPHYTGWRTGDTVNLTSRLIALSDVPDVAGLVFQATAPPGFMRSTSFYILPGGELGFTDTRRAAFLHKERMDPIDIAPDVRGPWELDLTLPYFPGLRKSEALWGGLREAENKQLMASIYGQIRTGRPLLPLWINDRTSDYSPASAAWFGTWDDPARLPNHGGGGSAKANLAAARAVSKVALLNAIVPATASTDPLKAFVQLVSDEGNRAVTDKWDGLVIDFSRLPADAAVKLLKSIPTPTGGR